MSGSIRRQHCWISGQLMLVILLFLLQAGGIYSSTLPANLTATDAYPFLGGYVVPVNGSITLHCEAKGPGYDRTTGLQWNIAMGIYSRNKTHASEFALKSKARFSHARVQEDVSNPDILRIRNLQISENISTVQCLVANLDDTGSQVITIYVEDIPNCVENINTSSTDTSYVVSWNSYNGLLPVLHILSIWSTSNEVLMSISTVHPMLHLNESTYSLQSNTTYFLFVTTCNSAGCSQDCGNTSIHTDPEDLHKRDLDSNLTQVGTLVIIVVPVAVALFTIILTVVVLLFCCILCHRMSSIKGVDQKYQSKQNDHEHMSEREVQETGDVSQTSMDVTGVVMKENPSYGTVLTRMGKTDIAELPPPLPLRPQDTVNLDMQENPSYSPLQTNSGKKVVY